MNGVAMQRMARHLEQCEPCGVEFAAWRQVQDALGSLGPAKAPESLQAQLVAAIAEQRAKGVHLTWHQQLARLWQVTLAPMALRAAMGTAAALVLVGGLSLVAMSAPASVEANDEPLGAVTLPHYLYSRVPPQAIDFGHDTPILVEASIDEEGRVYDYKIVSGPTDPRVEVRVQANLLSSVFQPATVYGLAVHGRVMLTYSGVSVRG